MIVYISNTSHASLDALSSIAYRKIEIFADAIEAATSLKN